MNSYLDMMDSESSRITDSVMSDVSAMDEFHSSSHYSVNIFNVDYEINLNNSSIKKAIWLTNEMWYSHRQELYRIDYLLRSILTKLPHNDRKILYLLKIIKRTCQDFTTRSWTLRKCGLLFEVCLKNISPRSYARKWKRLSILLNEFLDYVGAMENTTTTTAAGNCDMSSKFTGCEAELVCLCHLPQIFELRAKYPWFVNRHIDDCNTIIFFEIIKMDMSDKLRIIACFLKESKIFANRKAVHGEFKQIINLKKSLTDVYLNQWLNLLHVIQNIAKLIDACLKLKVKKEIKELNNNFNKISNVNSSSICSTEYNWKYFHSNTMNLWKTYVLSLMGLIQCIIDKPQIAVPFCSSNADDENDV